MCVRVFHHLQGGKKEKDREQTGRERGSRRRGAARG